MPTFGDRCLSELELRTLFGEFKARAFVICLVSSLLIGGLVTSALKSACGSPSAETGRKRADGPVTKGASEISNAFQEADDPLFRFNLIAAGRDRHFRRDTWD